MKALHASLALLAAVVLGIAVAWSPGSMRAAAVLREPSPEAAGGSSGPLLAPAVEDEGFAVEPPGTREALPRPEGDGLEEPAGAPRSFFGRVLDARHGRVIAGAQIVRLEPEDHPFRSPPASSAPSATVCAVSDLEGRFVLAVGEEGPERYELRHAGYSPLRFGSGGHPDPDQARDLRLRATARLIARVVGGGPEPVDVRLRLPGHFLFASDEPGRELGLDREWRSSCLPGEPSTLEDLPARVPLAVVISQGRRSRRIAEPLVLLPGESREATWSLVGDRLTGRLLRADRTPAAGEHVILLPRDGPTGPSLRALAAHERDDALSSAVTDLEGRFELDGIFPGEYWIGPLPRYDPAGRRAPYALGLPVAIDAPPRVPIEIVMPPDLFVTGRVLRSDDEAAAGVSVAVTSEALHRFWSSARTDEQGRFRLGPLPPVDVQVSAGIAGGSTVSAPAGTGDLVLRIREPARVLGRVLDGARGEPQHARLAFVSPSRPIFEYEARQGAFDLELSPGSYVVLATASGARSGALWSMDVVEGETLEDLVIPLERGAQLRVHSSPGACATRYRVLWNAHPIHVGILEPGREAVHTVPPGELELLSGLCGGPSSSSLHMHLVPGELREVELGN